MNSFFSNYQILQNLTQAISQLENAIITARETIQKKPSYPIEALDRLDHYMRMVDEQKACLQRISAYIAGSQYEKLSLEIARVNGLSRMVREDAGELISILANPESKPIRPFDPH